MYELSACVVSIARPLPAVRRSGDELWSSGRCDGANQQERPHTGSGVTADPSVTVHVCAPPWSPQLFEGFNVPKIQLIVFDEPWTTARQGRAPQSYQSVLRDMHFLNFGHALCAPSGGKGPDVHIKWRLTVPAATLVQEWRL